MHHHIIAGAAGKPPTPTETLVAIWQDASVDVRGLPDRRGETELVGLIAPEGVLTLRGMIIRYPFKDIWHIDIEFAPEGRAIANQYGVARKRRYATVQALVTAHKGAILAAYDAASQRAPGRSGASVGVGDCEPRRDDGEDRQTGAEGPAPSRALHPAPRHPEVVLHIDLDGPAGHPYAILAHCVWIARLEGVPKTELARFDSEARSGDYHNLLATAQRWFAVMLTHDGAPYEAL